ncbi:hypothetical protein TRVA0_024S00738 [Trichomonascus vanleenenianus]|uniref:acylglycerol lipase n=1 Tax=Trichomonascus vanleenenianus TaxID=2268995 RepID=UPI003ECA442A
MVTAVTSQFEVDGLKLHVKTWPASSATGYRGTLVVVHGFCDHADWYDTFAGQLSGQGYEVVAFDQRGYGKSAPNKKDYSITNEYYTFSDLDKFVASVVETHSRGKLFMLGHSMGGGIVLNYMVKGELRDRFDGYIALAPLVEVHADTAPGRVMRSLLSFMAKVAPHMRQNTNVKPEYLSHDKDVVTRTKRDDRRKPIGCYEGVNDMLARGRRLTSTVFVDKMVDKPLLVCHGDDDRINGIEGTRKFYNMCKVSDKTMLEYPGYFHELHNENEDRQVKFVQDVVQWLGKHSEALEPQTGAQAEAEQAEQATTVEEAKKTLEPPVTHVAEQRPSVDQVREEATEAAFAIGTAGAIGAAATGSGLPHKHHSPHHTPPLAARDKLPSTEVKEEMAEAAAAIGTTGAVGAAATASGMPKPHAVPIHKKEAPPKESKKEMEPESPKEPDPTPAEGFAAPRPGVSADKLDEPLKLAEAEDEAEEKAELAAANNAGKQQVDEQLKEAEVVEPSKTAEGITKPEVQVSKPEGPVVVELPKQPESVPEIQTASGGTSEGEEEEEEDETSDKVDELTPGATNGVQTVSAKASTDSVKKNKNKNKNKNKKKKKGKK